jgi:integrase
MREFTMVEMKLAGVVRDVDRYGKVRYYLRGKFKGEKKIAIKGEFGSAEFAQNYADALNKRTSVAPSLVVSKTSFQYLCNAYVASIDFKTKYTIESQKWRIAMLRKMCLTIGEKPAARIAKGHVNTWLDARADRPEAANNLLKCLRDLFAFGVRREMVKTDPTEGLKKIQAYSEGFHTWTVPEVFQYMDKHPTGSRARMALSIALYSGLRRKDVAVLGRQHIGPDVKIHFKGAAKSRRKKNKDLKLPILADLQVEFDAVPQGQMIFLQSNRGRPFSAASLGNTFRKWCEEAGLNHCSMHGLRKAGATIAANNGATDQQLMAIYGWTKADMATLYTEQRDREKLADDGMKFLHFERPENEKVSNPKPLTVQQLKKAANDQ